MDNISIVITMIITTVSTKQLLATKLLKVVIHTEDTRAINAFAHKIAARSTLNLAADLTLITTITTNSIQKIIKGTL